MFFLVSDSCCEHISYIDNIGSNKPKTGMTEIIIDDDNGKFTKVKIVLNRYVLILILCYLETESKKVNEKEDTTLSNKRGE